MDVLDLLTKYLEERGLEMERRNGAVPWNGGTKVQVLAGDLRQTFDLIEPGSFERVYKAVSVSPDNFSIWDVRL